MADYRKEIELSRKTKLFYVDFTPLIAHAHGNLISILNGKQLQVIETISTHQSCVRCIDVSPLKSRILSADAFGLVLIHQLLRPKVADPRCHQQSLVLCRYRWVLKFKVDVSGPEPTLTLRGSFVGDLFVTLRSHSFCIWTKVPGKVFENIHCCYDATECPVPAKSSCVVHGPANLDAQISPDGRMIAVLAENNGTVKVWYNRLYDAGMGSEAAESAEFGLSSFSMEHGCVVLVCGFKGNNYFETGGRYIPNVLLTVTEDCAAHVWVENLAQSTMEFFELETISDFVGEHIRPSFAFMEPRHKDQVFSYQRDHVLTTKLLNPHADRTFYLMKDSNDLGVVRPNYLRTPNDWLCFITPNYFYVYKLEGVRSYPSGPAVYLSSKVPNTLSKLENVYQIAGLHAIALNEDRRTMRIYGYNGEFSLATWHKSFGAKADSPCRLDSIFFSEQGPVLLAALHPSLPLFLNVSEHEKGQIVLISYEKEKEFTHAGHFIPREGASRQRIREVFWLGHLPLFCILTQELTLKLVGPAIQPVAEDIDSYAAMLAYSMNTCTPYLWKSYFSRDLSSLHISPEKILHVATLSDPDRDRFTEVMILLEGNAAVLIFLRIGNVLSQDDLEVQLKVKGRTELKLCGEIREKHVLRLPTNRHEAFRVAFTTEKSMQIYTMCALPKKGGLKCDMAGEILLPAESDKIRVNSFQIPLIAIMDKANVVPLNS